MAATRPQLRGHVDKGHAAPVAPARWHRRHLWHALIADTAAGGLAVLLAVALELRTQERGMGHSPSQVLAVCLATPMWLVMLTIAGAYEIRAFGSGTDEYRRVMNAGLIAIAVASTLAFAFRLNLTRWFVLVGIPLAIVFTILDRYLLRRSLHRRWRSGRDVRRTLLVGDAADVEALGARLQHATWAGFSVIGVCTPDAIDSIQIENGPRLVPFGPPSEVRRAVDQLTIDTIVITSGRGFGASGLRDLTWDLEGRSVQMLVAPVVTDTVGPRITSRPVTGLPLLQIEEPRLSVAGKVFKAAFDRVATLIALVLLSPLMLLTAVVVKLTSSGPVFYRQTRVGLGGNEFELLKFRTMVAGADQMLPDLAGWNDADGPLFKLRDDPRCTRVGRHLRRFSIDELPQLLQVLTGRMSMVGPRPPLPSEVETYDRRLHRKFLVKPGITGLWQVSGRSELPWDEAMRLDLYYVDNWSPTMDLAICARTIKVVFRRSGAY